MKPKTHVVILLDKSGSMKKTKDSAISGYNEQVQMLKQQANDGHDIKVSLITFNSDIFEHVWEASVDELEEVNPNDFNPEGGTAMRDAVGFAIRKLLDTTDTKDENASYLVKIISDGETLNDRIYSVPVLKNLINSCQKTGAWTFNYIGCSEEYLKEISYQTSIPLSNMAVWSNATDHLAKRGLQASTMRSNKYFDERKMGIKCSYTYENDVDGKVSDYTDTTKTVEEMAGVANSVSSPILKTPVAEKENLNVPVASLNLDETTTVPFRYKTNNLEKKRIFQF